MTTRVAFLMVGVIVGWTIGAAAQTPSPAPTPNPPIREQCAADVKKFCGDVQPGDGRIVQCLQQNEDKLSQGCKDARAAMRRQIERKSAPNPN